MRIVPPLHLDFMPRRAPVSLPWLLLAAGVTAAAGAGLILQDHHAKQDAMRTSAAPASAARAGQTAERLEAAERRLALPWGLILSGIDAAVPEDTVLLAIEPDADRGQLQIVAEAKTAEAMTAFVGALVKGRQFSSVFLVSHQIRTEDSEKPLRFSVAARWAP
jgi:Tfp pilus assembly protein PilN